MSIEQDKGKGPRLSDRERDQARRLAWTKFREPFFVYCGHEAKKIIAELQLCDPEAQRRNDPDVAAAMRIAEDRMWRRLNPGEFSPESLQEIERAEDTELDRIMLLRMEPAALAARIEEKARMNDYIAQCDLSEKDDSDESPDLLEMLDSPMFNQWITLKFELAQFFKRALNFMALDPDGKKELKRFGAKEAIKARSGERSAPKARFHEWAKHIMQTSRLSRNALAEKYIREVERDFKFTKVRAWLTPKAGWNSAAQVHDDVG